MFDFNFFLLNLYQCVYSFILQNKIIIIFCIICIIILILVVLYFTQKTLEEIETQDKLTKRLKCIFPKEEISIDCYIKNTDKHQKKTIDIWINSSILHLEESCYKCECQKLEEGISILEKIILYEIELYDELKKKLNKYNKKNFFLYDIEFCLDFIKNSFKFELSYDDAFSSYEYDNKIEEKEKKTKINTNFKITIVNRNFENICELFNLAIVCFIEILYLKQEYIPKTIHISKIHIHYLENQNCFELSCEKITQNISNVLTIKFKEIEDCKNRLLNFLK